MSASPAFKLELDIYLLSSCEESKGFRIFKYYKP